MKNDSLREMLASHVRELRRNRERLRLGILLPDDDTAFVEALWNHLEAAWFEPTLILREQYSERILASLSDDNQFKLSDGIGEYENVLEDAERLIHENALDLLAIPPGRGWRLAEKLQELDEELIPQSAAGFALLHPALLGRPLLVGDLFSNTGGEPDRLERVSRLGGQLLRSLGIEVPRAALLAAVETVSEGIPATVTAEAAARKLAGEENLAVEGPLSMDLAISPHAAEKKGIAGNVAGHADLLVAPNLTVARGVFHALTCLCEEPSAMVIAGGSVPIAMAGICDGPEGVVLSTLFAGVLASSTF